MHKSPRQKVDLAQNAFYGVMNRCNDNIFEYLIVLKSEALTFAKEYLYP